MSRRKRMRDVCDGGVVSEAVRQVHEHLSTWDYDRAIANAEEAELDLQDQLHSIVNKLAKKNKWPKKILARIWGCAFEDFRRLE